MMMCRLLCAVCLSVPLLAGAQGNSSQDYRPSERQAEAAAAKKRLAERRAKALERCKANRGVDCDTPEGLREWLLQERTRREAVNEGSRRRPPAQH